MVLYTAAVRRYRFSITSHHGTIYLILSNVFYNMHFYYVLRQSTSLFTEIGTVHVLLNNYHSRDNIFYLYCHIVELSKNNLTKSHLQIRNPTGFRRDIYAGFVFLTFLLESLFHYPSHSASKKLATQK